jgi:Ca-activated chloride channel family protein
VIVAVPTGQTTVILAMDVSRSMCSTDVAPNRLLAAETAASAFVQRQGSTTQIGIVAFAGFGELIQPPTSDQEVLLDAIQGLSTGRRTAIGSAILESIDAIAEIDTSVAQSVTEGSGGVAPQPVPKGAYAPHIIVLLTDGVSNAGPEPVEAAQQAADRGVRIYTIGFGTSNPPPSLPVCGAQYIGREPGDNGFGGGAGFGGGPFRRGIDEDTLKQVAEMTGGTYSSAESSNELQKVFAELPTSLILKNEVTEVSVFFVAAGVVLLGLAFLLSQAWRPLP